MKKVATSAFSMSKLAKSKLAKSILAVLVLVVALGAGIFIGREGSNTTSKDAAFTTTTVTARPFVPTAADLVNRASESIDKINGLTADITVDFPTAANSPYPTNSLTRTQFTQQIRATSRGDFWSRSSGNSIKTSVFSPQTGDMLNCSGKDDASLSCIQLHGATQLDVDSPLDFVFKTLAELRKRGDVDAMAQPTTFAGRDSWQATLPANATNKADVVLTIDKQSSFPVKILSHVNGMTNASVEFNNFLVNPTFASDAFSQQLPSNAQLLEIAHAKPAQPTSLDQLKNVVQGDVLIPKHLPSGFSLAEIAGNGAQKFGVITYRKGLESFVVSVGTQGFNDENPLLTNDLTSPLPAEIELSRGALSGWDGEIIDFNEQTQLWVQAIRDVYTVSGAIDKDETIEIANSIDELTPQVG